ncbi:hypothetical protein ACH5TX_07485, partial [Flavobacteriaceae bacterium MEBiC06459]
DGADGDSAYQIWLDNENTGTKADFLASLVGETGAQGPQGVAGNDGADGADGVNGTNGVDGADGDSAYQIWLDNENTGTEAVFLASLKGDKGDKGDTGNQGPQGVPGNDGADGSDATVTITNNLTSTSTTEALSAAQGKVLKDLVDTKVNTTIINDLTTGGTTNALSAEQGKTLENSKAAKTNVLELDNTNAFTPDADYEPATKKYVDDSNTTIINDLTTGGTTDALSAEQGKTLQDSKLDKTLTNTNLLVGNSSNVATSVALSGDATLANDGTLTITDNAIDGTDISLSGETAGDMTYFNGTDWVRLPKGSANQSLVMNSGATAPEWQSGGATEDVEVVLGSATGGNGTIIPIPANVSDYKYIRLETDNWYVGSDLHAVHVHGTALVSNMANKRILIYADADRNYLHADVNASRTSLTVNCTGSATWRIVGIKAQKTVLNPSLATVINDLTTGGTTDALSAEQGKILENSKATKANVLELDNTNAFTPDTDYEPATKKYVDDSNTNIINDLTTGGTTDALSAEQGKTLQDSKLDKTLTNTNLLVGNSSNVATSVALSGDATLANDGTLTITDNAIDGTDISLSGETAGDMAYFNGTDWVRLPKGSANQSLVMNNGATAPEWQSGGATEDVEVVLASATGGYGTIIPIPANVSDYKYIRLETDNWDIATDLHAVHGTILVSNMAGKRILIYADTVYYFHADINASGTSLTVHCSGTADFRIVGIKAQKTVLDPSLTTVIDDDTFATASSSNVPSAESVKAYVDANSNPAYSTAEQLTGRTWVDGKPIYERSFVGNYNASINILTGVDKIITSNISVRYNGSSDWYSGTTSTDDVALIKRATGNVNIAGSGGFNTNDYIIVVTYTKL